MNKQYFVYILRSVSGRFYIGITNNIVKRVWEHKNKVFEGFTARYNINMLVYYEIYMDSQTAINREKQLKTWNRKKKITLIIKHNPTFKEITFDNLLG